MGRYNGMAPMGWIYALWFPNGKVYVGQTRRFEDRMNEHRRSEFPTEHKKQKSDNRTKLKYAIRKYTWAAVRVEILVHNVDPANIDAEEQKWIRHHDSIKNGYNTLEGGELKPWDIPEVAEHLRNVHKTEEYKAKQRAAWTPARRANSRNGNLQRMEVDGGARLREIMADARSKRTPETFAKILAKQHATRDAAIALLPPDMQIKKRRQAEKDSARHARNRAAKKLAAAQVEVLASSSTAFDSDADPDWFLFD